MAMKLFTENAEMTFGEVITETSYIEFSHEYFDIIKEAHEIELMELYIESYDFLRENIDTIDEDSKKNFMCEAEDADKAESLKSQYESKSLQTIDKIANGIKRLWATVIAFWKRILNVFTGAYNKRMEVLSAKLKEAGAKIDEQKAKLAANGEEFVKKVNSIIEEFDFQVALTESKVAKSAPAQFLRKMADVAETPILKARYKMLSALIEEEVKVFIPSNVVNLPDVMRKVQKFINSGSNMSQASINNLAATLDKEISNIKNKDTKIKSTRIISNDKLNAELESFEKFQKDLDIFVSKVKESKNANKDKKEKLNKGDAKNSDIVKKFMDIHKFLSHTTAEGMKSMQKIKKAKEDALSIAEKLESKVVEKKAS